MFAKSQNLPPPQAKAIFFEKNRYEWLDCAILDYDADSKKFTIEILSNGKQKSVNRLGLFFNWEDSESFFERVNLAKNLVKQSLQDQRLEQYIKEVPQFHFRSMPKAFLATFTHVLQTLNPKDASTYLKKLQAGYSLRMKYNYVLKEMQRPELRPMFDRFRIQVASKAQVVPCHGTLTIPQSQPFSKKRESLDKRYICRTRALEKAIKSVIAAFYENREYTLFSDNMSLYGTPLDIVKKLTRNALNAFKRKR